jgi:hypothetical protein
MTTAQDEETPMRCYDCGETAELICVDCEDAFCPEHLHSLGQHWANVVCGECMDREMAGAK